MGVDRKELLGAMGELEQYQFILIRSDATIVKVLRREQ
jgi:hypothetical protein